MIKQSFRYKVTLNNSKINDIKISEGLGITIFLLKDKKQKEQLSMLQLFSSKVEIAFISVLNYLILFLLFIYLQCKFY